MVDYTYDPLYRLTAADYSTGELFHYTYDTVGNRLTQDTPAGTNVYAYDITNRLTEVGGAPNAWDANGNLLNDGTSTYTYNHANRLATVTEGADTYEFRYSGLGDGTTSYLYGAGRIGEEQPGGWQYRPHRP